MQDERKVLWLTAAVLTAALGLLFVLNLLRADWTFGSRIYRNLFTFLTTVFVIALVTGVFLRFARNMSYDLSLLSHLNESMARLNTSMNPDFRCGELLSILMDLYDGKEGVLLVTERTLRSFVTTDTFTNQKTMPKDAAQQRYRYQTFSPSTIPSEWEDRIKTIVNEARLWAYDSVVVIPVSDGGTTWAIAVIGTGPISSRQTDWLREMTGILVKHAVTFLQNAVLHEEVRIASITDPLTQLYNRRYFQARLSEQFALAKRQEFPISLMISDLDNFKHIVDTYGHPAGDAILARAAQVAKSALRETDIICRFGGDEFAYLLPFTSSSEALLVADRVRNAVAAHGYDNPDPAVPVTLTMSIGIAAFPEHGATEEDILRNADSALFSAKQQGRNIVTVYSNSGGVLC